MYCVHPPVVTMTGLITQKGNAVMTITGYKIRAEAKPSLFEYIEIFYNRKPRPAFLKYITPVEFEMNYTSH